MSEHALTDSDRETIANAADERMWAMNAENVSDEVLAHADRKLWSAVEAVIERRSQIDHDADALSEVGTLLARYAALLDIEPRGHWGQEVAQALLERGDNCIRMRHDDLDRQYQLVLKHHVDYITRKEAPIAVQHEVILQHEEHLGMGDWYDELRVKPGQDLSHLLGPNYPDHRLVTRTTTIHETVDPKSAAGKTPAGES